MPRPSSSIAAIVLRATQLVTCPLIVPAVVFVAPDSALRDELVEEAGLIVGALLLVFFTATAVLEGRASLGGRGR